MKGFSFVEPMLTAKSPHPLPLYTLMSTHGLSLVEVSESYSLAVCRLLIVVASLVAEHRL